MDNGLDISKDIRIKAVNIVFGTSIAISLLTIETTACFIATDYEDKVAEHDKRDTLLIEVSERQDHAIITV